MSAALQGQKCDYCKTHPSVCDSVTPVPRPYPDHKKLPIFHYNTHSNTPVYKEDGITPREIDDFNPRVQIKKQFECGNLSSGDAEAIKSISRLCIIPEEFVLKRVRHLEYLKLKRTKRAESTKRRAEREKNKGFDEYNWRDLYYSGKIDKLPGHVLDKYITHYSLQRKRLVAEKLHLVKQHIQKGFATFAGHIEDPPATLGTGSSDTSDESVSQDDSTGDKCSNEDIVLAACESTSRSASESSSEDENPRPFVAFGQSRSRQGRNIRPPPRFLDYY